jgi:hypothetical protein
MKGRTQTEGIGEQDAEKNIWAEENVLIGGWSKLHNEELHNLYASPSSPVESSCEDGNKPSSSIKCWEILE